jgi:3'-phosphoadenosine 5'-phosphosulfate sulfotransferase (PAPS reductase)/FAD synthetase
VITNEELKSIDNPIVFDSFIKAKSVLAKHTNISVSVSGGADSDVVVDLISKVGDGKNIRYIFLDTGVELQATRDHLTYLEGVYGITIERIKAEKVIPTTSKEFGQPFLSKSVSEHLERLQRHGFKFKDEPFDKLIQEFPRAQGSVRWWCNRYEVKDGMTSSMFNINRNKWLKEFLIANPPTFNISNKCCYYAKKKPSSHFAKSHSVDLQIVGIRKAEGGVRSAATTCYSDRKQYAVYKPLFWYTDSDKRYYEQHFGVTHSECYTKYGMKRTGCVGCPFAKDLGKELAIYDTYEPKMGKACRHIFKDTYEYTKAYREFCAEMNFKQKAQKSDPDQVTIYDL